jgi:hypothetical protein
MAHYHLANLSIRHVGIADCRDLKLYEFEVASNGRTSIPNFIKICPLIRTGDDVITSNRRTEQAHKVFLAYDRA